MDYRETTVPCPDVECKEGYIFVYNVYAPDPMVGERIICPACHGSGFVVSFVNRDEVN